MDIRRLEWVRAPESFQKRPDGLEVDAYEAVFGELAPEAPAGASSARGEPTQVPAVPAEAHPARSSGHASLDGGLDACRDPAARPVAPGSASTPGTASKPLFASPAAFVADLAGSARRVSLRTGLPVDFILAQAALESGWGRREVRGPGGERTFNLFGIKADTGWRGPVVESSTWEFEGGQAVERLGRFRRYANYGEAFEDYARFLLDNPRYRGVLQRVRSTPEDLTRAMAASGYATDPAYGTKLLSIIRMLRRVTA